MSAPSDDIEKSIQHIEAALMEQDIEKASLILESIPSALIRENSRFHEFATKIRSFREEKANVVRILSDAQHLLDNNDPGQALPLYQEVVSIAPDNSEARAGLQECRRKLDHRHKINVLIQGIRRAREKGEFSSARELCREWLQMNPDNDRARVLLSDLERIISREREVIVMLNRGRELINLGRYQQAIRELETLEDIVPGTELAQPLIKEALECINQQIQYNDSRSLLEDASRLLTQGHYQAAMRRLESIENPDTDVKIDLNLLKRKIKHHQETNETEKTLIKKLQDAVFREDYEDARVWLQMILELNPGSDIMEKLKRDLSVEQYINLTE